MVTIMDIAVKIWNFTDTTATFALGYKWKNIFSWVISASWYRNAQTNSFGRVLQSDQYAVDKRHLHLRQRPAPAAVCATTGRSVQKLANTGWQSVWQGLNEQCIINAVKTKSLPKFVTNGSFAWYTLVCVYSAFTMTLQQYQS